MVRWKRSTVMVELTEADKTTIKNMPKRAKKYCEYPDKGYTPEEITEWMEIQKNKCFQRAICKIKTTKK